MYLLYILVLITLCNAKDDLRLKQVLALSRHNIRTPLTSNLERLANKKWPEWEGKPGFLTKKGALLESYLGEYFHQWLTKEGLLTKNCPEDILIYANTKQRTKESAKAFISNFGDCNLTVYAKNITAMDPVFNPVRHNENEEVHKAVIKDMVDKLCKTNLTESYKELDRIINIKDSVICKEEHYCDFFEKGHVEYEIGEEPFVSGRLSIGNSVVDSIVMSYYDGKPCEQVAWGEITRPEQWQLLTEITRENQLVRFSSPLVAKDVSGPLLKYMAELLAYDLRKFILLMGHDSNLNPVISALNFKPFKLVGQYEPFPIGGKLVFERWTNGDDDFLKVEYIYLSFSQIRSGARLGLNNLPLKVTMELENCIADEEGFCPWQDFVEILQEFLK